MYLILLTRAQRHRLLAAHPWLNRRYVSKALHYKTSSPMAEHIRELALDLGGILYESIPHKHGDEPPRL